MSSQSYSSIGGMPHRRRGTAHEDIDRSFYAVGQTLASIVNDPRAPSQAASFWGLAQEVSQPSQPPPLDPARYPPISAADVQRYLDLVRGGHARFVADRQSLAAFDAQHRDAAAGGSSSSSAEGEWVWVVSRVLRPRHQAVLASTASPQPPESHCVHTTRADCWAGTLVRLHTRSCCVASRCRVLTAPAIAPAEPAAAGRALHGGSGSSADAVLPGGLLRRLVS